MIEKLMEKAIEIGFFYRYVILLNRVKKRGLRMRLGGQSHP